MKMEHLKGVFLYMSNDYGKFLVLGCMRRKGNVFAHEFE